MPKQMDINTSYNIGISSTTIVQCDVACKWLQPGSGLVDAFLTGLVDACETNQRAKKRGRSMILTDTPVKN